jgi:hypothetical protein
MKKSKFSSKRLSKVNSFVDKNILKFSQGIKKLTSKEWR